MTETGAPTPYIRSTGLGVGTRLVCSLHHRLQTAKHSVSRLWTPPSQQR
ncbi:hypothetical protein LNQ03_22760 [Klebsiella pneumoniae subsp. pneumoniae]|nr:hypothetical protein [Klebsiella pneumoniae subsp. pneumoniae]